MSKSLLRIVEFSLLPAVLLVVGKILGVLIAGEVLGKNISITTASKSFLGYDITVSKNSLLAINSLSDFFMYLFVALYFAFVVYRALALHNTHVKESVVHKLAKKNLLHWISSSYDLYHLAVAAGIFLWAGNIIIWVSVFQEKTSLFTGVLTLFVSLVMTGLVVQDMYREIDEKIDR